MLTRGALLNDCYEIIDEIGEGGTGIIYLAYHIRLEKRVVVKKVKDNFVGKINERAEADILKRLHHRYLPQVYDFVQMGTDIYTVMDYIEGYDLMQYVKSNTCFPEVQIHIWLRQLCEVLEYLHSQVPAIIHSDIKPSNIMVCSDGNICLIDFNISFDGDSGKKVSGYTENYASPEQVYRSQLYLSGGNYMSVHLDARSDIYSLGASIYQVLTGRYPIGPDGCIIPITQLDLSYSDDLLRIIEKAMQPDPNLRYQSAQEMLGDLVNIKKRDKDVRRLKKTQLILSITCAVFLAIGIGCTIAGSMERTEEAFLTEYDKLVAEKDQEEYETVIDTGIDLLNNKKYSRAMNNNSKEKADILYMIANCYFEQDDYTDSLSFYSDAIELNQENAEYFRDYAIALARSGDTSKAQTALDKAVALNLGEDHIYLVQAEIELAEGNGEESISDFQKAISLTTDEYLKARAYILCARAYRSLDETEKEVAILTEGANAADSEHLPSILRALGASCSRYISQYGADEDVSAYIKKAKKCYSLLIEGDNATFNDYMNLAILYQLNQEYDDSISQLEDMLQTYPEDYRIYMRLALVEMIRMSKEDEDYRDYSKTKEYYDQAEEYYKKESNSGKSDETMQQLETKMKELQEKGWLN